MNQPSMYQVMPPLSDEEYEALKADIAEHGVQVPVEYDEAGNILDGYHRVQACRELDITDWPRITRINLTEAEKRAHARSLNLNRRHLNQEQRRTLIAGQLRETPELSDRQIASGLGVDHKTVGAVREDVLAGGEIPHLDTSQGADGKFYPRQRSRPSTQWEPEPPDEPQPVPEAPACLSEMPLPEPPDRLAVHYSSDSQEWYTPQDIIERVVKALGPIDLDPCSDPGETPNVDALEHFTAAMDGLSRSWFGAVYMNPPYGRTIKDWVTKLCSEYRAGHTTAAVALVPARTDTDWFRQFRDYAVCFIDGRLKFSGMENSAPFPSCAVYLGEDVKQFHAAFRDLGDVWLRYEDLS